ncbi:MAG: hypothetical protein FWC52_05935 [Candidatus Methanoplasma sp.]|nr:hypothetical protein [Candidatus Methanoplasma sp.]
MKWNKGKHHNEVLVACANSMARMMWTMVTGDRMYSADPTLTEVTRHLTDSGEIEDKMEAAQTE